MALTITEALAELKTLDKRIEKKQQFVAQHLYRQERFKDPLERDGGSVEVLRRERQGINDLIERRIALRTAIAKSNLETTVSINGTSRCVHDWLVWKREAAPKIQQFLSTMAGGINQTREQAKKQGLTLVAPGQQASNEADVIVHVNERELADERENLEMALGQLDGQLSLKNATTTVSV